MINLLKILGFALSLSNPPNGYSECAYAHLPGEQRYFCRVWFDWSGWVNIEGKITNIKTDER